MLPDFLARGQVCLKIYMRPDALMVKMSQFSVVSYGFGLDVLYTSYNLNGFLMAVTCIGASWTFGPYLISLCP